MEARPGRLLVRGACEMLDSGKSVHGR